jgi:tRNA dimethylallyltransferase
MPKLTVILGPTGVGKTDLSLQLAEQWGCPIVSADSRQIYRDLPIGTAAPSLEEQQRVKHYFIGIKDLHEDYNAGQYARDCNALLQELFTQHEHVIMVGGSMMYIDAVCKGLDDIPEVPEQIRTQVRESYKLNGLEWLQQEVQRLDPEYWEQVDQQNPQRLMHCVEVTLASEKPYSQFRLGGHKTNKNNHFDIKYIMIERPREELYERINLRVDKMLEAGLEAEARAVLPYRHFNSLKTGGYSEMFDYFDGKIDFEQAVELIKRNSRRYAKRQLTWFGRDKDIRWFENDQLEEIVKYIDSQFGE